MILKLLRRGGPPVAIIDALYGAIVAQARRPSFYLAYGVPDTLEGRFDLIVLHQFLLMQRIARDGTAARALGQGVFDRFCRDLDGNLREMGVSDLGVPRRMRSFAEAFYGRARAYDRAFAHGDGAALAEVVERNVFGREGPPSAGARRLSDYMLVAAGDLARQSSSELTKGVLNFPDPDAVPDRSAAGD